MKLIYFGAAALFGAGLFWFNLVGLVPTNQNYHHEWWKVVAGIFLFIYFFHLAIEHDRSKRP